MDDLWMDEGQGQTLKSLKSNISKLYEIERKCQWKLDRKSWMGCRIVWKYSIQLTSEGQMSNPGKFEVKYRKNGTRLIKNVKIRQSSRSNNTKFEIEYLRVGERSYMCGVLNCGKWIEIRWPLGQGETLTILKLNISKPLRDRECKCNNNYIQIVFYLTVEM